MQTNKLKQIVVKELTAYPTNKPIPKADNHEVKVKVKVTLQLTVSQSLRR
jgi:hypothetical protein